MSVTIPVNMARRLAPAHALVNFEPVDAEPALVDQAASGHARRRSRRARYSRTLDLPSPTMIGAR